MPHVSVRGRSSQLSTKASTVLEKQLASHARYFSNKWMFQLYKSNVRVLEIQAVALDGARKWTL